jgi:hypothetical protein
VAALHKKGVRRMKEGSVTAGFIEPMLHNEKDEPVGSDRREPMVYVWFSVNVLREHTDTQSCPAKSGTRPGSACCTGNPNPEPLHMRLKGRALQAQQRSCSAGPRHHPVGLLKSSQYLFSLLVFEHPAHFPGVRGRDRAIRVRRRRNSRLQVVQRNLSTPARGTILPRAR